MLPPGLDAASLATLLIAAFLGGLSRGFTGFGFAMIYVPIASLVLGPPGALVTLWFIDIPVALVMGTRAARKADARQSLTLLAGAVFGLPVGIHLLVTLDPLIMRWVIATIILCAVVPLMLGWRYQRRADRRTTIGVGVLSGLGNGLAGLSGAPLALFWLSDASRSRAEIRADMQFFFALSTFVSGALLAWRGLMSWHLAHVALFAAPLFALGVILGSGGYRLASEATFRRIAYAMIIAAAVLASPALDGVVR